MSAPIIDLYREIATGKIFHGSFLAGGRVADAVRRGVTFNADEVELVGKQLPPRITHVSWETMAGEILFREYLYDNELPRQSESVVYLKMIYRINQIIRELETSETRIILI